MDFNNLNVKGPLNSGVDQLIFETTIQAATNNIVISGLNGDEDLEYVFDIDFKNDGSNTSEYFIRPGNDSTNSYYNQYLLAENTGIYAARNYTTGFRLTGGGLVNTNGRFNERVLLHAKSGKIRIASEQTAYNISGTTVFGVGLLGHVWNNNSYNIQTFTIYTPTTSGIGVGSRLALYVRRKNDNLNNTANIKGNLKAGVDTLVFENTLTEAATSVVVSGLDGNTAENFRIIWRPVANTGVNLKLQINNDTSSNYGYQYLRGRASTVSGSRGSSDRILCVTNTQAVGNTALIDLILKSKSGGIRSGLILSANEISGASVSNIDIIGVSWNNTSDNITTLTFTGDVANGLGPGSYLAILSPNRSTDTNGAYNSFGTSVGKLFANCFETLSESILTSDLSNVTISGIDGETDKLLFLTVDWINGGTGSSQPYFQLAGNDSNLYGQQSVYGENASKAAARGGYSTPSLLGMPYASASDRIGSIELLIYSKSGQVRPALAKVLRDITTSLVSIVSAEGCSMNDSITPINSIELKGTGGNLYKAGTRFRLQTLKRKV